VTLPADLRARPARGTGGAAIASLMRACDETYLSWTPPGWTPPAPPPEWPQRLSDPDYWAQVVVDGPGRVVGLVAFRPARSGDEPGGAAGEPLPGVAHLGVLLVHPARWREGIGATLLARAEAAMAAGGYRRARLWTPAGAPAERFYRACGWAPDGRRGLNPWLGLDVVGYAKPLPSSTRPAPPAARSAPAPPGARLAPAPPGARSAPAPAGARSRPGSGR
jgi:GNAT superfamily N-acetyltransferase